MREFLNFHMDVVYFVYGQVFFITGLAILLKNRRHSSFRLARHIWLLAAFALIHGLGEWGSLFIPRSSASVESGLTYQLLQLQDLVWAVSFAAMLLFAVLMLAPRITWSKRLHDNVAYYAVGWSILVIACGFIFFPLGYNETWIRYVLAFPACVFTAAAFFLKSRDLKELSVEKARLAMNVLGACFVAYAITGGLVVPVGSVIPGLDYDSFFAFLGIPVQIIRAATGLVMAFAIIRVLSIFDIEVNERIKKKEVVQTLWEDRRRIARDLHDGTVQAIYATGLQLEAASAGLEAHHPDDARDTIRGVLDNLNAIIADIRKYIFELDFSKNSKIMQQQIEDIVEEFSSGEPMDIEFSVRGETRGLSLRRQHNIVLIVHECLSNAIKHSLAGQASVILDFRGSKIRLVVEDNGVGLDEFTLAEAVEAKGGGLRNIQERTASMGGSVELDTFFKAGTRLYFYIPFSSEDASGLGGRLVESEAQ